MIGEYTVEGTDEDVGARRRRGGGTSTEDVDGPNSGDRGGGAGRQGNTNVDGRQNNTAVNPPQGSYYPWLIVAICKLLLILKAMYIIHNYAYFVCCLFRWFFHCGFGLKLPILLSQELKES